MEADTEIEALRSIFGNEISIVPNYDTASTTVRKKVRPIDEEGVSSASIIVELELGPKYPEISPKVRLSNPRGFSDESYQKLCEEVHSKLEKSLGVPVVFDILQHCADFIVEHQHLPSLACPICLCVMTSVGVSTTPCDHFVHTECLEQHVEHTRKQLGEKLAARGFKMCDDVDKSLHCPVCRVVIEEEVEPILQPSPPPGRRRRSSLKERETAANRRLVKQESYSDFEFDWERWREQQAALMVIYERQKAKGGIIDLDEERRKNLVTEDTVIVLGTELHNLDVGPSVSGAGNSAPEVTSVDKTLDVPPGFEEVVPCDSALNTSQKQDMRGSYTNRGRGRGRRPRDSHYRGSGRGDRRSHYVQHRPSSSRNDSDAHHRTENPSLPEKRSSNFVSYSGSFYHPRRPFHRKGYRHHDQVEQAAVNE